MTIQLKLRTEYSFGNTFAPISRIIDHLKESDVKAAGIVDELSTWGHVPWFKACKSAEITPLLGVELVVTEDETNPRMWFLAKNKTGLRELYQNASRAHRQAVTGSFGRRPRLYRADVENLSEDILIFAGDYTDGGWLRDLGAYLDFGPGSFVLTAKKNELAKKYGLKTVNVCDNSYVKESDKDVYEMMNRPMLKPTPQYIIDVSVNTHMEEIAEMCAGLELPIAPMIHQDGDLEALCRQGIKDRTKKRGLVWSDEYEQRLKSELDMIRSKDFESYFLIVSEMTIYAKQHMLVGPSRGSAAGSLVCYLTHITEVDPLPASLYFERFIDISRKDMPDIDLDFPDDKRHIVFEYMANKYGDSNVAHIGNINRYKPRSAIDQVVKKLGIRVSEARVVKDALIERSAQDNRANSCLEDTLNTTEPGREFLKRYPQAAIASLLEGHASHTGVHAAGLLICNDEITNYAVVDHNGIAHIDKRSAEDLGLLKIDILGLRTLGILEDSGIKLDWYSLPLDDEKTFEIFNQGKFACIFQFEGKTMRGVSKDMKFESLSDIDAVTALARPGPLGGGVTTNYVKRMNGEPYEALHPLVEPYMKHTFGLPIYQEQTMAIVKEVGLFDWEGVTIVRKAIAKSMGKEFFDKYWPMFRDGAEKNGITEEEARKIWELINTMGAWQMNKAHTYSYAVVSYWTAYLKAHYPLEFAAANLRNAKDDDSALALLREMDREGIKHIPFDLEKSEANWSVKDGKLYGGFISLKGIGPKTAITYVENRNSKTLTAKQLEKIEKAENVFEIIYPLQHRFKEYYENEDPTKIRTEIWKIADITKENVPRNMSIAFIGEVIQKSLQNMNDLIQIKKRGGKVETGKDLAFCDVRIKDDTGEIGGRISRWDYSKIGKELIEKVPIGAILLIRADFVYRRDNGEFMEYAFIKKWKRID